MRTFEQIELWAVAIAILIPIVFGRRLRRGLISIVLITTFVLQTLFEGFRWHLLPLHITALVMAFADFGWVNRRVTGFRRIRRGVLGPIGIYALTLLPSLFPVIDLPRPGGVYPIGTTTFVITDPERPETLAPSSEGGTEAPMGLRRLVVQAWYPAEVPKGSQPQVWNPDWDLLGPAVARWAHVPGFLISHLGDVPSHSYPHAVPMSGRFPVIIYSHGWAGFRTAALDQIESMASRGYMVLSIDHPYAAMAIRFPDSGEIIHMNPDAMPKKSDLSGEAYSEAIWELERVFVDDVKLVMNELDLGAEGQFARISNSYFAESYGLIGHGSGAAAVLWNCFNDDRCAAVVCLDTWTEAILDRIVSRDLKKPALFFRSGTELGSDSDQRLEGVIYRAQNDVWSATVQQAKTADFMMAPLLTPLTRRFGHSGGVDPRELNLVLNRLVDAFFDRTVLEMDDVVLGSVQIPELEVVHYPPPE